MKGLFVLLTFAVSGVILASTPVKVIIITKSSNMAHYKNCVVIIPQRTGDSDLGEIAKGTASTRTLERYSDEFGPHFSEEVKALHKKSIEIHCNGVDYFAAYDVKHVKERRGEYFDAEAILAKQEAESLIGFMKRKPNVVFLKPHASKASLAKLVDELKKQGVTPSVD